MGGEHRREQLPAWDAKKMVITKRPTAVISAAAGDCPSSVVGFSVPRGARIVQNTNRGRINIPVRLCLLLFPPTHWIHVNQKVYV